MGKIRTKLIGVDAVEKEQKKAAKARREAKKASKETTKKVEAEKLTPPEETTAKPVEAKKESVIQEKPQKAKKTRAKIKSRGEKYLTAKQLVDKNKKYSVTAAVSLLKKMPSAGFDETVELHLNLVDKGLKGQVTLPHGTGKAVRVAIVNEAVIKSIEKGKIDFDILISHPSNMAKLVTFAKLLGPKGLMPNPKNGTVSEDPEKAAEKFKSGGLQYKSESQFPLLHQAVGKRSFGDKPLEENIETFISAVNKKNIKSLYLKSTMSPSIAINLD